MLDRQYLMRCKQALIKQYNILEKSLLKEDLKTNNDDLYEELENKQNFVLNNINLIDEIFEEEDINGLKLLEEKLIGNLKGMLENE